MQQLIDSLDTSGMKVEVLDFRGSGQQKVQLPAARYPGQAFQIQNNSKSEVSVGNECSVGHGQRKVFTRVAVPTVNRMVHYQAHGSPNGQHRSVPRCAIVTAVPERQVPGQLFLSLCILNPTGQYFNETVPYSETPKPGHWNWPPIEPVQEREIEVTL